MGLYCLYWMFSRGKEKGEPFLKILMAGDEKWITYKSVRKRLWLKGKQAPQTTAIRGFIRNDSMLMYSGIEIHYKLLLPGKTINLDLYCQQLMRLKQGVEKKWLKFINKMGVVFHHDNTRPHTSSATQKILRVWLRSINVSII
ncbi:Histone-lysine N-methyltransferase SETMAR [Eumeta japonica]|uniref:Histone-lysine N-methyltransferase SETMAR n=1 Tax=Eumeta variegata TaxID=151549 RepID=A0A4C1Z0P7_EUMVA|nr:Histone-lysine N-methyltransferase SETMAR [Eumeta japonica]